jgi:hypothetical protein
VKNQELFSKNAEGVFTDMIDTEKRIEIEKMAAII